MLLLNLTRIRTAQERFEKVYEPGQLGTDPDFRVVAPVSLAFDIFKDKQQFRLVGWVQTTLELYAHVTEDADMRSVAEWRAFTAGWRAVSSAGEQTGPRA